MGNQTGDVSARERPQIDRSAVAYAISWNQLDAPIVLEALLARKIFPRVAAKPFVAVLVGGKSQKFAQGTIVVNLHDKGAAQALEQALLRAPSVIVAALSSGLTIEGPDLGSRDMKALHPVKVALLVGSGVSPTEAGALWYFFDRRIGAPLTLLDMDRLGKTDISEYTHILMAGGQYDRLSSHADVLKSWIDVGGVLVAQKGGAQWAIKNIVPARDDEGEEDKAEQDDGDGEGSAPQYRAYQDFERDNGDRLVRGAVFKAVADLTHPYGYGFQREEVPLFRTWNKTIDRAEISYDTPFRYSDEPLLSGFVSAEKRDELAGTPAIAVHRLGKGLVVTAADDLVFRGLWRGSERLYANIIYFSQTIEDRKDDD